MDYIILDFHLYLQPAVAVQCSGMPLGEAILVLGQLKTDSRNI